MVESREDHILNLGFASRSRIAAFCGNAVPRGLALFLGGFTLLNLLGNLRSARFDANVWWLHLRFLPRAVSQPLLLVSAFCLLGLGLRQPRSTWRRFLTGSCVAALALGAIQNTAQFYVLLSRHALSSAVPIPLSLLVSAALGIILAAAWRPHWLRIEKEQFFPVIAVCLACGIGFPLAQMICFGNTDYRRPADVAVVLGARVYADGSPSVALADRVRTACQLYRDGLTKKLLFSGGPGDGLVHETAAMKRMALEMGVKEDDILVDEAGLNTQATARNSEAIFSRLQPARILVVSHFYHLPRIKMSYERDGWEVYTVPAKQNYLLRQLPYNMAREVAALWVYYLRPLGKSEFR